MAKKPIWMEIESMSKRKQEKNLVAHQKNHASFVKATTNCVGRLTLLERNIKKSEQRIIKFLEQEKQAEAISEILQLRALRIEEMVELSTLSLTRANRFYNKLVLDVTEGVQANVKYDAESIKKMVPDELKTLISDSVAASDFYDILAKYKDHLSEFIQPSGGESS